MPPPTPMTIAINRFCEFLVVVTHAILHKHKVYPARLFSPYRKYNICTPCSKHPTLNNYIHRTIASLRPWLLSAKLESIAIPVFKVESGIPVARYVFEVSLPGCRNGGEDLEAKDLAELDVQLRAHLVRILAENVEAGDEELGWEIVVRTVGVVCGKDWVPADGKERREINGGVAIPLKDRQGGARTLAFASRVEMPE